MLHRNKTVVLLAALISLSFETNAFVIPVPSATARIVLGNQRIGNHHAKSTDWSSSVINRKAKEEYGEGSRKYRRTVFTHDDWVRHRSIDSPNKFLRNLLTTPKSGVYKSVGKEVLATTVVAILVVTWNCVVGGYTNFHGAQMPPLIDLPLIGFPLPLFTLITPSLGLLLVFRSNTSYKRWDEARKNWGMNINHTRDLVRMATAWYGTETTTPVDPAKREEDLRQVSLCTWAFVRSMKRHLSPPGEDDVDFKAELYERLSKEQAEGIIAAMHRPNKALSDLSNAIDVLPMHFLRKNQINEALTIFEDNLGSSERLLSSPVPLFYSRHTARMIFFWLLLLPLALWDPFEGSWNHITMIPATSLISLCLLAIDEISTQLEEPFTVLPMQGFCDKIGANCDEIVSWAAEREINGIGAVNGGEATLNGNKARIKNVVKVKVNGDKDKENAVIANVEENMHNVTYSM